MRPYSDTTHHVAADLSRYHSIDDVPIRAYITEDDEPPSAESTGRILTEHRKQSEGNYWLLVVIYHPKREEGSTEAVPTDATSIQ